MNYHQQLLDRIQNKTARLGIVGLGYVGLPLAVEFARAGLRVVGVDLDPAKVEALRQGESYIGDVPGAALQELIQQQRFSVNTDYATLNAVDVVCICVPTPLTPHHEPDMSYVLTAAHGLRPAYHAGMLISLESTVYPGATEEVFLPVLKEAGLTVGQDAFLVFSPERIDPGNTRFGVRNTAKVVGGATPACVEAARALYALAVDRLAIVSSLRAAEVTKLLENTFRAVNISFINEMAIICEKLDVDVWEVIEAANTKPYGFMKFTPGPGIGGHCLSGNEVVMVRRADGSELMRLSDLTIQLQSESQTHLVHNQDDTVVLAPHELEILSFDPEQRETIFRSVQYVSRRVHRGAMVTVWTQDGRRLTSTDGHPMLIWEDNRLAMHLASELRPGQELVIPLGQPEGEAFSIDLLDHLAPADINRMRAKPHSTCFADYADALRPQLLRLNIPPRDVFEQNVMPLSSYLILEREGHMPIPRRAIRLATGRGPSYNLFPAVVSIDERFARLLGYYLSEGCLSEEAKALRVRFTFHADEKQTIADLIDILQSLGVRYSTYQDKQWRSYHIKVSSRPLGLLLRDVLKCGVGSNSMRIPGRLLTAPTPIRWALLTGLLRGDGDVHHHHGQHTYIKRGRSYRHWSNSCQAGYFSNSPILFQQVVFLLQGFDFMPTFKRNKPQARLYGQTQLERLKPLFLDQKRRRLEAYMRRRRKTMPTSHSVRHTGFATVKVREVVAAPPAEAVYSVEVAGTHTFITSFGLLVHNCIPLDPLYLSWKMRSLGYTARFVELADKVNLEMPGHVVSLIVRALNDVGKSLKGAHVLLLGMAYKKDIDDLRESPALEVLELLHQWQANVSFHDPHVAQLHQRDHSLLASVPLTPETLRAADCVVILTDHSAIDWALVRREAALVVDTRNALKGTSGGARVTTL